MLERVQLEQKQTQSVVVPLQKTMELSLFQIPPM